MKKVGFFQSVRLKLILVYILLLLLGIQVIGVYFVNNLESNLKENFISSIDDRIKWLKYSLEQAFQEERGEDDPSLESAVQSILSDFDSRDGDISKILVVDNNSRILAAYGQHINEQDDVGKKTNERNIQSTLLLGDTNEQEVMDDGDRVLKKTFPIKAPDNSVVGAIYLEAQMDEIYQQLREINGIFAKGTALSITITALLGILVARTITKPITEMRRQAKVMATGDFSQKVNVYGTDEIGQLAVTFNDLNEKLQLAQATTEGERRKLSSVLSNMSDGVIATDRLGAITLMNTPASKLIGQPFEEVQGQSLIDVLNINDQISDISEVQDAGSMLIDMSTDDQYLVLKANFSFVLDEYQHMNGFITVISDVTEQEKVERERREFVSNVSHELRTPLTTMRSYIEALAEGAWQDKEIAPRFLEVTQNETERMIRLVNDLLQLTKMDNQGYDLLKERIEFIEFYHHVIDRFEMNKAEDIVFERQLPREEIYVWIDKDKVTQVMDNIISNAIKYSPEGGTIRFRVQKVRNKLQVSVSDEGMGIPAEKVDKIFDRFYRVDKARTRKLGGTGLGLAIARDMIEAHHGEIWAESKEHHGTTVIFTLPLMKKKRRGGK
ncbi:cell wall metabolism sensor histidine kinase WalK [Thalassobacillus pellis]|uniref:cell wall metabolism sensor histidine kinase WalK n=1 Tax=Thalassobacillus pellis TaxID=748008 RepID=UPI00195FCD2A|nr:cell wall metabolism sensor histidine kinase WalK [Thalassobacillus pellis]MBM7552174.1 two-component system sensor histidine kinase VicK [Thalassobacillus pellis]